MTLPLHRMSFTVPGPPVPKPRARVMVGYSYTPPRAREYERLVALHARQARPDGWPLDAEYRVRIAVYRARRAGDLDNFGKMALDGTQKVLFANDSQIRELHVLRFDGEEPRMFVEVEALE